MTLEHAETMQTEAIVETNLGSRYYNNKIDT
jgi:hypothetical protein